MKVFARVTLDDDSYAAGCGPRNRYLVRTAGNPLYIDRFRTKKAAETFAAELNAAYKACHHLDRSKGTPVTDQCSVTITWEERPDAV